MDHLELIMKSLRRGLLVSFSLNTAEYNGSVCAGGMTQLSRKGNKEDITHTVWLVTARLRPVGLRVHDTPETANFSGSDTAPQWHFSAISCWWAKFMQHNPNLRGSLRRMFTPLGSDQDEVKHNSSAPAAENSRWRRGLKPLARPSWWFQLQRLV